MVSFSSILEDQKKRLTNVKDTLLIAGSKVINTSTFGLAGALIPAIKTESQGSIIANVENKSLKAGLEFVANNPATVAAVAAGGTLAIKNPTTVVKAISSLSTKSKVIAGVSAVTVVPAVSNLVVSNPEKALGLVSDITPESSISYFQKLSDVRSVDDALELAKSNPTLTAIGIGGLLVAGGAATKGLVATGASIYNTLALKDATDLVRGLDKAERLGDAKNQNIPTTSTSYPDSPYIPDISNTPPISTVGDTTTSSLPSPTDSPVVPIGTKSVVKKKRPAKRISKQIPRNVNVRVNNILAGKFIY